MVLSVVAIWGSNFVIIKQVLHDLPPLLFAALRFFFVFFPAILFFARPRLPHWHLACYGLLIGVGQFGILYIAIEKHIAPGLASLVVQTQVFFSLGLAWLWGKEAVAGRQLAGLLMAFVGIAVIFFNTDGSSTVLGVVLVLLAAFSWALGNMVGKHSVAQGGPINMLAYVVWSSLYAVPVLLAMSWLWEGKAQMVSGLLRMDASTWLGVLWQSYANSLYGYAVWGWLLGRYMASAVVPMALLVPVFGMGAAWLFLAESLPAWKWAAAGLILLGLAVGKGK